MKRIQYIVVGLLYISINACTNNNSIKKQPVTDNNPNQPPAVAIGLNEQQVKDIIIKDLQLPRIETRTFYVGIRNFDGGNVQPPVYAGERILQENAMREIRHMGTHEDLTGSVLSFHNTDISFEFTQKAQPYILSTDGNTSKVKVSDISFNTLKTLRKVSDTEYEAEFSLSKAINIFGEAYDNWVNAKYRCIDYRVNDYNFDAFRVRIFKYENSGWALATEDTRSIKKGFDPEQYKYSR